MKTKKSCLEGEPLARLDETGSASILNYNLPQSVTYDVVSLIQIHVERSKFKPKELERPKDNYWARIEAEKKKTDNFTVDSVTKVVNGKAYSPIPELQNLALNLNAATPATSSGLR